MPPGRSFFNRASAPAQALGGTREVRGEYPAGDREVGSGARRGAQEMVERLLNPFLSQGAGE